MPSNYILIERIELNASAASVTFANIPQTGYTDLKFVMSARQSTAAVAADILVRFNANAANNSNRYLLGDSVNASSGTNGYTPSSNYISIGVGNNATANTFSNVEMYIPNYSSSSNKTFSVDSVSESNGSSSVFQLMVAGLWASSSAINQITVTPASSQSFLQYSTFSIYGIASVGASPSIAPKATGGNVVDTDGTYWIHTFTSSGTFTPITALTCDYLVVAGGGGGGQGYVDGGNAGGGGGAGGLRSTVGATGGGGSLETALSLSTISYSVTVGAGGASNSTGSNSAFSSIISAGGGKGGYNSNNTVAVGNRGGAGGSGGGGGYLLNLGGAGTTNQGYAGGSGQDGGGYGGGGGGAGQVGNTGGQGKGGDGVQTSISGTARYYAGGGSSAYNGQAGGLGGGGNGAANGAAVGGAATVNTGGGGGGGGGTYSAGGAGGSGVVIIRYLM